MKKRKRRRSLIKRPGAKKPNKDEVSPMHVFRTNASDPITHILNRMTNKSEFIMEAIREHAKKKHSVSCPRCKGTGRIIMQKSKV